MLFCRKGALFILSTLFITSYGQNEDSVQSNSRSYDTNDWIPVSRPAAPGEGSQADGIQKRPSGRVLNLPIQDGKRFYPSEQQPIGNQQQFRIPPETIKQQPQLVQSQVLQPPPYVPNGQQQVLLPPQLQSLISQNQPYLSPQKINQQLAPTQSVDYVLPTQNVPINSTNYNTRDFIQNINLGLYNLQPSTNQQPQQPQQQQIHHIKQPNNHEQPEVQLLYVPLENLRQRGQRQQVVFPTEQTITPPQKYNPSSQQQYQSPVQLKQVQLQNIQQDFTQQALQAQKLQEQFQHNQALQSYRRPFPEVISQPQTTPVPKKRKPHQPPLAVYMGSGQPEIKIGDVLSLLKEAKSIAVQDTIGPDSPQVFVGPSHLEPPDGYAKFDLPYLTSIDNNRVERKVDQLPFFVAPLSYKAPPGYSKIPFPAPHVGSVVINHSKATPSTTTAKNYYPQTLEESSSHIPFSQQEVSTIRSTRGRQRHPSHNAYTASTIQSPVSTDIPFGPLPTRVTPEVQQPHSVQEALISPNPYGPTRFIQTTTPAIRDKPVNLPQEIFSTKNRFSTSPEYNNHNAQNNPVRPTQYSHRPDALPTEPTLTPSTLSASLTNDKYTVLEQYPIRQKQINQQSEDFYHGSNRPLSRRPSQTQEQYDINSTGKTALPLVSNAHISNNNEFDGQVSFKQQYNTQDSQQIDQAYQNYEEISTKQNLQEPSKQIITETYQDISSRPRFNENDQNVQHVTPSRQKVVHNYEEIPTQQTYHEQSKQRVTETYQEVPVRQRVTETYQEVPVRQRVTENYQDAQQISQNSSPHQVLLNEHTQTTPQAQEYEVPIRHVSQQSKLRGQQHIHQNYDRKPQINDNVQFTSAAQTQRTRGKQHFTPDTYFQNEYQHQDENKSTESLISVTKEPLIEYKIPDDQAHYVPDVRNHQQLSQNVYYHDQPQQDVIPSNQEYTLPAKLPPISPHLPGLINSLQDQQLRPLLAPLLIPPSEETPTVDPKSESQESEEYYSSPIPHIVHLPSSTSTTTSTTTTTTTPEPITVSTTTAFKRTRGRQRGTRPTVSYDYVSSTTATPRRPTQYRGRRPYNGQSRQEYKPRENYPVSTTSRPEVYTESSTRATYNRNRHTPQVQYVSSTTEQPRRNPSSSRQRFRTRGRPMKSEEEYIERSTPSISFKQPVLEGGFQASVPVRQQNVPLTDSRYHTDLEGNIGDEPNVSQRPQKEQALVYIQNKAIDQDASPVPDIYIPRQQFVSSTEVLEPIKHSTVSATGPENNFVPDIVHEQPTILSAQPQIKYVNPTETNFNSQEELNSKEETIVQEPHIKYNPEPEIKQQPTTEFIRSRTRPRIKSRGRINPAVSTARYQPSYSTTTTQRTTTEAKQEEKEEFYGFFRQPNFGKPPQTEKSRLDLIPPSPTPSPKPNYVYLSSSTEEPQQHRFYVNSEPNPVISSPKTYIPSSHIEDSYVEPNIQVYRQYISNTAAPVVSTPEEPIIDIKPVTRRPVLRRRPNISAERTADLPSASSEQTDDKYYVRSTKRPEVHTSRPTRIRGRIRKPTRPSTEQSLESHNSHIHASASNELDNNNSEENVPSVKSRQRLINRGKSHFQSPRSEKVTEEPEEENYPVSFLQRHQQQLSPNAESYNTASASTPQPVILTTQDSVTPRPVFQLTIEPEDGDEEYSDQVPYSSVNQPSVVNKDLEEGVEESKFLAKFVQKPKNFNYIVSEEKAIVTTEKHIEPSTEKDAEEIIQQTTAKVNEETIQPTEITTTDLPVTTTVPLTEKPKGHRRGVWRLVKTRLVGDELESAESQNIQSIFNENDFSVPEKPIRKYKVVQRIRTTTEPYKYETTTSEIPETTMKQQNEITTQKFVESSTTDSNIFASLYEMFGYNSESHLMEDNNDEIDATTTENIVPDEIETTTLVNNSTEIPSIKTQDKMLSYSDMMQESEGSSESNESWQSKIIGTSTTTEISHETEICYRGRCVKSTSTEENSEERL